MLQQDQKQYNQIFLVCQVKNTIYGRICGDYKKQSPTGLKPAGDCHQQIRNNF